MGWTKRQIIEQAFNEIGTAGYVFDLEPEQLQAALRQLDTMMALWLTKNINLGYSAALTPDHSEINAESGIPIWAIDAVVLNLAVRVGSAMGKAVTAEVKANAKDALNTILIRAAQPSAVQMPGTMPAGAGNKPWRDYDNPFLRPANEDPIQVGQNGQLNFLGG